jgi:hypothetical protein
MTKNFGVPLGYPCQECVTMRNNRQAPVAQRIEHQASNPIAGDHSGSLETTRSPLDYVFAHLFRGPGAATECPCCQELYHVPLDSALDPTLTGSPWVHGQDCICLACRTLKRLASSPHQNPTVDPPPPTVGTSAGVDCSGGTEVPRVESQVTHGSTAES